MHKWLSVFLKLFVAIIGSVNFVIIEEGVEKPIQFEEREEQSFANTQTSRRQSLSGQLRYSEIGKSLLPGPLRPARSIVGWSAC